MRRLVVWLFTHGVALTIGFALGIYMLPILIAPESPKVEMLQEKAQNALFSAEFKRDLSGSDFLHWGEGTVSISDQAIALEGELAPGPDYRLYLSPTFVEDEAGFEAARASMVQVGNVSTFKGFMVPLAPTINPADYTTVIVWCEAFGEFITAARYQSG